MVVNKSVLTDVVAEKAGISKKDAGLAINAVFECIKDALSDGNKVQILGFGTFEVRERGERVGRNPQTGESMTIPASKAPAFKAGKTLKDAVSK